MKCDMVTWMKGYNAGYIAANKHANNKLKEAALTMKLDKTGIFSKEEVKNVKGHEKGR